MTNETIVATVESCLRLRHFVEFQDRFAGDARH